MGKEQLTPVSLSAMERVTLRQLLAQQTGSLMTAQVLDRFARDLGFTEQEIMDWEVLEAPDGSRIQWQPAKAQDRTYRFTPWRMSKVTAMLRQLDTAGLVEARHLPLFEKFGVRPPEAVDPELAAEFEALEEDESEAEGADVPIMSIVS